MFSRILMVSGLRFRSLIHFEFIFVYGVGKWFIEKTVFSPLYILLHVAVQFSQYHLLKRLSFSCCMFIPALSKIN